MRLLLPLLLLSAAAAATRLPEHSRLFRREDVCSDLSIDSNNGNRKVAIVIDSSGSMVDSDPDNLRLAAGKALVSFLISDSEATGSKPADEVTVINFDDEAYVDYPLGDPGKVGNAFDGIGADGGTFIAGGVAEAISQLTAANTGSTAQRSAIVVFTDGEDSDTSELVEAINNATALGIRVSFGFLDNDASEQPTEILNAIQASRGVYATITVAAGSINFINYVILNGLTYNDNPQGYNTQLLSGLAETHVINGSNTVTLTYSAQQGENVNFTLTSITADNVTAVAQMNGQTLQSTSGTASFLGEPVIAVKAPSTGSMQLLVSANGAPPNSLFSVVTDSDQPIKNCTVGVASNVSSGLSSGAKAGIGIGVTAAVLGLLGAGGYFAWKHFGGVNNPMAGSGNAPMAGSGNAPMTGGAENTMNGFGNGAEKVMPHTSVAPMNAPMNAPPNGLPPGQSPMASMPGGQAPMSAAGQVPMNVATQAPMSAMAPGGGQAVMNAIPAAAGAGAAVGGSTPFAFAPGLPPNLSKPNGPGKEGQDQSNMDQNGQETLHDASSFTGSPEAKLGPNGPTYQQIVYPDGYQPQLVYADGSQAQIISPNTTGSLDPGSVYQHPVSPDPYQHPMAPGGQQVMGQSWQGPMGTDGFQHTMAPGGQQIMGPGSQHIMGPDGFQHTMPAGGYNHPMSTGSSTQAVSSPASTNVPLSTPGSTPFTHQGISPIGNGPDTGSSQPGFTMPGVQLRQGGKEAKHHHHAWLAPDTACEHPQCPLIASDHVCSPDKEPCPCTCVDPECPVTKRGLGGATV